MSCRTLRRAMLLGILVTVGVVRAGDPPDAEVNPVSGAIEITDELEVSGDFEIRHVEQLGENGTPTTILLTDNAADDFGPRIDITPDGDTWVVWWRDSATPEAYLMVRDQATGDWSAEFRASGEGEAARHPSITNDGVATWVAYEATVSSTIQIKVFPTDDGPDPLPLATVVGTTTYAGNRDVLVQSEIGYVWVSWVASATTVGWSAYDSENEEWTTPETESYDGETVTVKDARAAIRAAVLGDDK